MSKEASWRPFEGGSTLGLPGSQGGTITRDEEYAGKARLTLEQDASRAFYAITCGVTGWLVHTRFFGSAWEASAGFEEMRPALVELLSRLPAKPSRAAGELLSEFVARYD